MDSEARKSGFTDLPPQRQAIMLKRYERIIELNRHLNAVLDLPPLLQLIIEAARELTDSENSSILLVDQKSGDLYFEATTVARKEKLQRVIVPMDKSIAGWVVQHNEAVVIEDVEKNDRHFKQADTEIAYITRNMIAVPLSVKGRVIGVLNALNKTGGQSFAEDDVNVLTILAAQAAVAIENARLYQDTLQMKEFNEGLVQSMAEGIAVTDAEGHITLVNPAAATLLGYAPEELVGQRWTAIIPSDYLPIVEAANQSRVRGESDKYELELMHKDGRRIPVLVSGSPRFDADTGHFAGTMAVFTDITQVLAHQKVEQELALAWQIQASFLPDVLPDVPGWQLTATLEPARETSGDFYDLIPLANGRLGIVIADVAGKGMGAALYMAVSRTLIHIYAVEYDTQPELAFGAANGRILTDTHADLFVTVFYGILDPVAGTLTYCNAGHNPPYLLSARNGDAVQTLVRTGIPLGIFDDMTWEQRTVHLAPGDMLVLYTDGVTEAQNAQETFFGKERLLEVVRTNLGQPAQNVQNALLAEVHEFVGDAPQFDDITLMVIVRSATSNTTLPE